MGDWRSGPLKFGLPNTSSPELLIPLVIPGNNKSLIPATYAHSPPRLPSAGCPSGS